ncbi:MAG: LysM domain-containing protein [Anaerolineales bacterium]|nr:LysM domain-containing protein [Anaerolineales bacterium]
MKQAFLFFLILSVLLSSCNLLRRPAAGTPTAQVSPTQQPDFPPRNADTRGTETPTAQASPTQEQADRMPEFEAQAVTILSPAGGETYPFFASLPVLVAAVSGKAEIVMQELLVNGKVVATQRGEEIRAVMHWLANRPGRNTLQVRIQTSDGKTLLSETVEVNISPKPVGFDILAETKGGETLAGLAGQYGLDPQKVADYNPGVAVGLNDPLPAGLVLRLPVEPVIPPDVLAEFAPEVAQAQETGQSLASPTIFLPPPQPVLDPSLPPLFDKVYYYLSLNGGPWSRVPRLPGEFITPTYGMFNLDEVLQGVVSAPAQGTLRAEIDAWGWSGGTLLYIGRFEKVFVAESGREPFVVLAGQLDICDLPSSNCAQGFGNFGNEALTYEGGVYELRWAPPPGAEGGVWQVSRWPFDEACAPDPVGVFRSGGVEITGLQTFFKVDFPAPGQDAYSIPIFQPGVGNVSLSSTWFPQTYYVRVLPVFNGAVKCVPSNTVTLTVDPSTRPEVTIIAPTPQPAAPTPPLVFDVEIVNFKPIDFPDWKFYYCVVIVENPFYEKKAKVVDGWLGGPYIVDGKVTLLEYIKPGTVLCPKPYVYQEPPFLEQVGEFLKDVINKISEVYAILKGLVVKLVVKAIPLCYASEFVEAYKEEIDSVCNAAAEAIVSAAMAYVGLPPSLPNYEQLKETAKGKLTELAIQQLEEQTGLPCIEICQDFIRDRVDEMWEAGEELLNSKQAGCISEVDAHRLGFEPLCLPGNVKTQPDPRGVLHPAQVQVKVTRRSDAPNSALPNSLLFDTKCDLTVVSSAVNETWKGQSIFLGVNQYGKKEYWQGATLTAPDLFKPERLSLPLYEMAPGESREFYFALQPNRGTFPPHGGSKFWLPGRLGLTQEYWYNHGQSPNIVASDDWEYYYLGSQLTIDAVASCTTSPKSQQPLAPSTSAAEDTWVEKVPAEKAP